MSARGVRFENKKKGGPFDIARLFFKIFMGNALR